MLVPATNFLAHSELLQALRKIFYHVIVENKDHGLGEETNFDFKYVPNFSTTTELGTYENSGLGKGGVERRNFRTFITMSAVVGVASYFCMRTTWGLVGLVKARYSG